MSERVPRTTGEILSDGIGLLRSRFKTLYLLALPFCAVDIVLREGGSTVMAQARTVLAGNPADVSTDALLRALATLSGGMGLLMGSFVVLTALSAGVIQVASMTWRNEEATISDGLRAVTSRAGWLALTTILWALAFGLWMIPGFVLMFLMIALLGIVGQVLAVLVVLGWMALGLIVLTLRWGLYPQVVVIEDKAGLGAFGRSRDLLAGRGMPFLESPKWRLSLVFIILFAVTGTVQGMFAGPRAIYALTSGWEFVNGLPPLSAMPIYFAVPLALVEVALNSIVVTFGPTLLTLFYYDLRVRYEGLDLES
jgi:hypothetical protein